MKKILIILTLLFTWFSNVSYVNANWVDVIVTEKIPWANCTIIQWTGWNFDTWKDANWKQNHEYDFEKPTLYKCKVEKWWKSVIKMLWWIIKYFTFIVSLVWVLFIVINGILYSMSWLDEWLKKEAKERITLTLTWLLILLLSWAILQLIAPWIYK